MSKQLLDSVSPLPDTQKEEKTVKGKCKECGESCDDLRATTKVCAACNALKSRMNRIKGRNIAAVDLSKLSPEARQQFFKDAKDAKGQSLVDAILEVTKTIESVTAHAKRAKGLPASVYLQQGYTKENLKNLEKSCDKEWDNEIKDWV